MSRIRNIWHLGYDRIGFEGIVRKMYMYKTFVFDFAQTPGIELGNSQLRSEQSNHYSIRIIERNVYDYNATKSGCLTISVF